MEEKEIQKQLYLTKREVYMLKIEVLELRIKLDELIDYCRKMLIAQAK